MTNSFTNRDRNGMEEEEGADVLGSIECDFGPLKGDFGVHFNDIFLRVSIVSHRRAAEFYCHPYAR